eukprot:PLAT1682.1.p1 GENE.PLAT1682.1~~PLAT1682.1.p1  ORF type:complete len:356 (+),score=176.59 PLAT1682.1:49-1068(+)
MIVSLSLAGALALSYGIIFGIPLLWFLFYVLTSIKVVRAKTNMIVERWGRYNRLCGAGLHLVWPIRERARPVVWRHSETFMNRRGDQTVKIHQSRLTRIDMRETVMDFPNQPIITRDNVEIQVHPMLLYRLSDPLRVAYETFDLSHAVEKLVQTTLRSIIGDMGLDDTLASREEINRGLTQKISNVCKNWGLEITRIELLEIIPTRSVQDSMHKQLAAERIRRAAIVTADGEREQMKTEAEGECQAQIALATGDQQVKVARARGRADARLLVAQAEADALKLLAEELTDLGVEPTSYMIGLKYIETLREVALNASTRVVYFPFETDVVGSTADLGVADE